jgi:hypothetical protein
MFVLGQILSVASMCCFHLLMMTFAIAALETGSSYRIVVGTNSIDDFNFAAVGDWGCNSNTRKTLNNIMSKNPELVLGLGDYSYDTTAGCWLDIIEPINDRMKIAIGNHEHIIYRQTFGNGTYTSSSLLNEYMRHFNLTDQYYSFNYQDVHFLVMSSEVPFGIRSEQIRSKQYDFVKDDLEKASTNSSIRWIVVNFHRPIYLSPSQHVPNVDFRDIYHPIFDQYGVDLVLQGHNHNYQRSYPLKYNSNNPSSPIITDTNTVNYNDPEGEIYAVIGTGGIGFHHLVAQAHYMVYQQTTDFGFLNLDVTEGGTNLNAKFYDNDGSIRDQFTIIKPNSEGTNMSSLHNVQS